MSPTELATARPWPDLAPPLGDFGRDNPGQAVTNKAGWRAQGAADPPKAFRCQASAALAVPCRRKLELPPAVHGFDIRSGCYRRKILSRPVVLAVDDEKSIRDLLRETLEREGMEILCARSRAELESMASTTQVDVFLVDLTLPDGSGFSLVRTLRERGESGIIILSGRAEETDHVLGLELGADDYVTKPFRPRELAARVNAVLRRYRKSQGSGPAPKAEPAKKSATATQIAYRFGEYSLSISARLVWDAAGKEVALTTAEFELLCALIERRGRVVPRDQLMNAVKGRDWDAYDRAIDGLVSRLRRKLPVAPGRAHYIRTVHGVGYSFSAEIGGGSGR